MEDIVYKALNIYFNSLSELGYMKLSEVDKLLLLIIIEEFIYKDFRGMVTQEDYTYINEFLYKLFGKSCLISYPNFCKTRSMNKLHLGSITELANRVKTNEANILLILQTKVVKTLGNVVEEIDDIVPSA